MLQSINRILTPMIDFNIDHPEFNAEMEILCLLNVDPHETRMTDLMGDLGHDTQSPIKEMIETLTRRGFDMIMRESRRPPYRHHRVACVSKAGWEKAKKAAQKYWETVYRDF